jgi:hypothetical protein
MMKLFKWFFGAVTPCEKFGHYWVEEPITTWESREDHPGGPPGNDMMLNTYAVHSRECIRCPAQDRVTLLIDRDCVGSDQ